MARKGGQWTGAYNARPHETVYGAREDVEKQPATQFRLPNADKFQHNKDLTDRRIKAVEDVSSTDERGEELQPSVRQYGDVQRLRAVGSMTARSSEGPAEAAGAAGQRQRGGPTDETGQAGSWDFLAPPRPRTLD